MAKALYPRSSTSVILRVKLRHATTGLGLTGLSSASAGLIISTICDNEPTPVVYAQASSNIEGITTLGTYETPTASKCRFKEVDATNHKGIYEIHLANARFAVASAKELVISISGATNLYDVDIPIQLAPAPADLKEMGGDAQSATDLKDFADAGYDPTTNKVTTDAYDIVTNGTYGNQNIHTHAELVEDKIDAITAIVGTTGVVVGATDRAAIVDAVWDELLAGHLTEDTFGEAVSFILALTGTTDTNVATLIARLTAARAGYLDNLNVGGPVATAANVTAILQAARLRVVIPDWLERPDAGSTAFRVWIYVYDEQHKAEDLDANPTVTAENGAGTDRSANLGTVTKPGATTGQYYVDYTVASGHALEQIVFKVTATEGAVATIYPAVTLIVDTTAADFTADDRSKLVALYNKIPSKLYLAGTNNSDGDIEANEMTGNFPGTVGGIAGTINTLDGLNTSQNAQHTTTQAAVSAVAGDVTTLLSRITSTLFSGITSLANWIRAGFRSSAPDATALAEINTGGGGYAATMSQQGLKTTADALPAAVGARVLPELTGAADAPATPTADQAAMLLYMATRNNCTTTPTTRTIANNAGTQVLSAPVSDVADTLQQGKLT